MRLIEPYASMTPEQIAAVLQKPAMKPPTDVLPNFTHPPDMNHEVATIIFLIFSTLAVAIRMYTKLGILHQVHLEDGILLLAWIVDVGGFKTDTLLLELRHHYGAHMWNFRIGSFFQYDHHFYAAIILYNIVIGLLKTAIILQLIRLFTPRGSRNTTFWALHILLYFNVMFYIASVFVAIFDCIPIQKAWNQLLAGHCIEIRAYLIVAASLNTFTDIMILIFPQRVIWSMNMKMSKKLAVSALFLIGIVAVVCSAFRIYESVALFETEDRSYRMATLGNWTEPEVFCGFLVMCLPALPKFIGTVPGLKSLGTSLRSLFSRKSSAAYTKSASEPELGKAKQAASAGSGSKSRERHRPIITDIEFHSLVNKTSGGTASGSILEPENVV